MLQKWNVVSFQHKMFMIFTDFPKDFKFLQVFYRCINKLSKKLAMWVANLFMIKAYNFSSNHSDSHYLPHSYWNVIAGGFGLWWKHYHVKLLWILDWDWRLLIKMQIQKNNFANLDRNSGKFDKTLGKYFTKKINIHMSLALKK